MGKNTALKHISAFLNKTRNTTKLAKQAEKSRVGLAKLFSAYSLVAYEEEKG